MRRVTLRLLAAGCLAAATGALAQAPLPADAARVLLAEGETMLVRGTSYSSPVHSDVPLRGGDRIRTGADGRVQLRFVDGALISIQPGSDFRIEAYAYDAIRQRSFFELMQGSIRAVSGAIGKRDRDAWRLRTPTATIGIRGTEFTVAHTPCPPAGCAADAEAGLVVTVIAGRVAVSNQAGSVEVPAGATLRLRDARTVPTLAGVPRARGATPPPSASPPDRAAGSAADGPPGTGSSSGASSGAAAASPASSGSAASSGPSAASASASPDPADPPRRRSTAAGARSEPATPTDFGPPEGGAPALPTR